MTLNLPYDYKNKWNIWKNSILEHIDFSDCNNSTKGYCTINKTTKECIDSCQKDCSFGYNITLSNGEKICANIKNSKNTNPIYRLIPKETFPYLKNVKIDTFIKKDKYPFPPLEGKLVFYNDLLTIQNVKTRMILDIKNPIEYTNNDIPVTMANHKTNPVIILPLYDIPFLSQFTNVVFGDKISLNIPKTILFSMIKSNSLLHWKTKSYTGQKQEQEIILESLDNKKRNIIYGDEFLIKILDSYIIYNENNNLLESTNYTRENVINNNGVFKFITEQEVYYCDNNQCKTIKKEKLSNDGKYNKKNTYKSKNCWGLCNDKNLKSLGINNNNNNNNNNYTIIYMIIGMVLAIILTIVLLKLKYV